MPSRSAKRSQPARAPRPSRFGVTSATLANGLVVRLKEMHAAPVTTAAVYYRVGSRNEHVGLTGISHWVEHMMFKGTPRFSERDMDRLISRVGGSSNAFTWIDFTTYYATMPSDQIELVLRIEADRMARAMFDPREVERERKVIIGERQGSENSPVFRLVEEVMSAAFRAHAYGHTVIGHQTDLEAITRDELLAHYKRHYAPDNAIVCAAGDFDPAVMLAKIEKHFGGIAPAPKPRAQTTRRASVIEPPQKGERRVSVRGEGTTDYVLMAFHSPAATHPDYFPLVALDAALCGASGLSFFGGGTSNRSSRLSKALVDSGLASDVGGGVTPTIDPFVYELFATVQQGRDGDEVEAALWGELERAQRELLSQAELDKAIKQTRAQFAFSTESTSSQAFWLGFADMFADYGWFVHFVDRLSAVTPDDVRRVANEYFRRDNVTVGRYLADWAAEPAPASP